MFILIFFAIVFYLIQKAVSPSQASPIVHHDLRINYATTNGSNFSSDTSTGYCDFNNNSYSSDIITSPVYSYMPSNIYYSSFND